MRAFLQRRRGMVGLILTVLVLAYMMTIAMSHTRIVQSEHLGRAARANSKAAQFAALAGIHYCMAQLRQDANANTFNLGNPPTTRLYFSKQLAPADHITGHYRQWTNTHVRYPVLTYTRWCGEDSYHSTTPFTVYPTTSEVDPSLFTFVICSYPGPNATSTYYIKSQGTYTEPGGGSNFIAQAYAHLEIDSANRTISFIRAGYMPVQSLTVDVSALAVNDFWDWQNRF